MFQYQAIAINSNGERETVTLHHEALNVAAISFSKHFPNHVFIKWVSQVGEAIIDESACEAEAVEMIRSVGFAPYVERKYVAILGNKIEIRAVDRRGQRLKVAEGRQWGDVLSQVRGWVKAERFNQELSKMTLEQLTA